MTLSIIRNRYICILIQVLFKVKTVIKVTCNLKVISLCIFHYTLSRVCPLQSSNSKTNDSNIDVIPVHHIMQTALVSKTRLQELRLATQSDPTLSILAKTYTKSCHSLKKMAPSNCQTFGASGRKSAKKMD